MSGGKKSHSNRENFRKISVTDHLRNLAVRGTIDFGHTEMVIIFFTSLQNNLNLRQLLMILDRLKWLSN